MLKEKYLLTRERLLTLTKTSAKFEELVGWRPSTSTCYRWTSKGVRGGVKLDSIRIGGTVFSTETAILDFIERLSLPREEARGPQATKPHATEHAVAASQMHEIAQLRNATAKAHLDRVLGPRPARRAK